jgi:hypothetical protein
METIKFDKKSFEKQAVQAKNYKYYKIYVRLQFSDIKATC